MVILAPDDAAFFYRAWWPLLTWVNEQRRVVATVSPTDAGPAARPDTREPDPQGHVGDDRLRAGFLAEGASKLGEAERDLIASWQHRVSGKFVVLKHLQRHSIFMSESVYAVLGIYSPLAEIIPDVPMFVEAVLLPFRDRIIIDGLVESYGIQIAFGPGIRRSLNDQYARARESSQVHTALRAGRTTRPAAKRLQRGSRAKVPAHSIRGEWRITSTEVRRRDALDLVQPAFIHFGTAERGELGMIAVQAELDCR